MIYVLFSYGGEKNYSWCILVLIAIKAKTLCNFAKSQLAEDCLQVRRRIPSHPLHKNFEPLFILFSMRVKPLYFYNPLFLQITKDFGPCFGLFTNFCCHFQFQESRKFFFNIFMATNFQIKLLNKLL